VVYALLQMGWHACVAARRMEQALELCGALADKRGRLSVLKLEGEVISQMLMERRIGLVVNATPLGMGGRAGESPWPEGVPLPDMAFVYDLVYNPPETALMQAAKEAGLRCTNGLGMLVEQARLAFTLWTGCEVEREAMERAV
jgi:shikimate dehydrogenase